MFSLEKFEKIKKILLVVLIALSTFFISGFKNSYAYSFNEHSDETVFKDFAESFKTIGPSFVDDKRYVVTSFVYRDNSKERIVGYQYFVIDDDWKGKILVSPSRADITLNGGVGNFISISYYVATSKSSNSTYVWNNSVTPLFNKNVVSGFGTYPNADAALNPNGVSYYASDDVLYNADIDGDDTVLFHQPLVKEALNLLPSMKADTMVIVTVVGVFLVGLVICLTLLRKVSRIFLKG